MITPQPIRTPFSSAEWLDRHVIHVPTYFIMSGDLFRMEGLVLKTGKPHFTRDWTGKLFEFRLREDIKWRGHRLHE